MDKETRNSLIKMFVEYYSKRQMYKKERSQIIDSRPKPVNYGKGYDVSDPTFSKAIQLEKLDRRYDEYFKGMKGVELLLKSLKKENKGVLLERFINGNTIEKCASILFMGEMTVKRRTDEALCIYNSICQGMNIKVGLISGVKSGKIDIGRGV